MIAFSNIAYTVGNRSILTGISGRVVPGKVTAILGPNGAGKSTLLKIISGLHKAYKGSVSIDQQDLRSISIQKLARQRAVLSQIDSMTFPYTVRQVIAMGQSPYAADFGAAKCAQIIDYLLADFNMQHLEDRLFTTLSGGERQKVHLARVLAQLWREDTSQPAYLLLDEPTTYLDIRQQIQLLNRIETTKQQNIGILAILHDLNLAAQYGDYLLLLKNGRQMGFGTRDELMDEELLEDTFDTPLRIDHSRNMVDFPLVIPETETRAHNRYPYIGNTRSTYKESIVST